MNPKILYVADVEFLKNKMDLNAWHRAEALNKYDEVLRIHVKRGESIDAVELEKKYNPDLIIQEHIQPDFPLMLYNLDEVRCNTALILGDLHSNKDLINNLKQWKTIILFYPIGLSLHEHNPDAIFKVIPHHIPTNIYKDYKLDKLYDIVLYGNTYSKFYPFRDRLFKLFRSSGLRVKEINYPDVTGEELAKIINQSWLGVVTCSTEDYLVAKYLEIPACNCVPIGNVPKNNREEFSNIVLELTEDMDDNKILTKVKGWLQDKEYLQMLMKLNYEYIQKYNIDNWAKEIVNLNGA